MPSNTIASVSERSAAWASSSLLEHGRRGEAGLAPSRLRSAAMASASARIILLVLLAGRPGRRPASCSSASLTRSTEPVLEAGAAGRTTEKTATTIAGVTATQAEQADQAGVQARAGRALPQLRHDQLHQPARDQDAQQQQQDEVEIEQDQDACRRRRRKAEPAEISRRRWRCPRATRADGQQQRQAALDVAARRSQPAQAAARPAGRSASTNAP